MMAKATREVTKKVGIIQRTRRRIYCNMSASPSGRLETGVVGTPVSLYPIESQRNVSCMRETLLEEERKGVDRRGRRVLPRVKHLGRHIVHAVLGDAVAGRRSADADDGEIVSRHLHDL